MGEENRDSSGSSTSMIVIAILGGLLLVGCCGGVVVLGSFFMVGTRARNVQLDAVKAQQQELQMFEKAALDEAKKAQVEMERKTRSPSQTTEGPGFPIHFAPKIRQRREFRAKPRKINLA